MALLLHAAMVVAAGGGDLKIGRLFGMVHNFTDPACFKARVQCSSLATISTALPSGIATLPKPHDVPGLGFIQALQVVDASGANSYSIATDPNASNPAANTVLSVVAGADGELISTTPLPFVGVSTMAQGMLLHYDFATGDLFVGGRMARPPASLPHAVAGDHIVWKYRNDPSLGESSSGDPPRQGTMVAIGSFGGDDSIASVGAFDSSTGILWAQCIYDNGRTYSLLGMDTRSGRVVRNVTDPYMAGGMSCGGGRCFLIGITRELVRAGTFERVLVELRCSDGDAGSCAVSTPLLRLPSVCIMLGGLMTVDPKTQTIYGVLQNNSATAPCGGTGPSGSMTHHSDNRSSEVAALDLVLRRGGSQMAAAAALTPAADTGFKLVAIDYSSEAPTVAAEPVLCESIATCPISIAVA